MKASKNIFVVIASVVVALLLVGAAAMLGVGAWRLASSEGNLKGLKGTWRQFYEQGNPFPSRENVVKEKKNNETVDFWFAEIMKELRKGQVAPNMGLVGRLRQKVRDLLRGLMSQRRRNANLDLLPLLRCTTCYETDLSRQADTVHCAKCGTSFPVRNGVVAMNEGQKAAV